MANFKKLFLISGITAAVAIGGLTGCQTGRGAGDRSAGQVVDDNQITRDVQRQLQREPVYKFDDVDVKTYGRVVQLSGFVSTEDQKRRAEDVARRIEGVTQVVNNITLKPEHLTPTGRDDVRQPIDQETQRQQNQQYQQNQQNQYRDDTTTQPR